MDGPTAMVVVLCAAVLVVCCAITSSITDAATASDCKDFGRVKLNGVIYECKKATP